VSELPPEGYLHGAALDEYKVPFYGKCWWCGAQADSREHKFKKTDLRRMWGDEHLIHGGGDSERLAIVRGANSSLVKFRANLCARCKNQRSQPFDLAYDQFAGYVWSHPGSLWFRRYVDMAKVYGDSWPSSVPNLARYIVKHVGCRMSSEDSAHQMNFALS
jgi:hypothetical protein